MELAGMAIVVSECEHYILLCTKYKILAAACACDRQLLYVRIGQNPHRTLHE